MVNDENRIQIQDPPLVRGMDSRIQIHTKMSWIRNTRNFVTFNRVGSPEGGRTTTNLQPFYPSMSPNKFSWIKLFHSVLQIQLGWEWEKVSIRIRNPGWTTRIIFLELWNHFFAFFGLKYLNSVMRIRDPGIRDGDSSDPGWKKVGSGINIPDPGSSTLVAFVKTRCDPVLRIWIRCLFDPLMGRKSASC